MPNVQPEGYHTLTDEQKALFERVHKRHMTAWGRENQRKYARHNIVELKWDEEEKTVNVYYPDVWWHYDEKGDWY